MGLMQSALNGASRDGVTRGISVGDAVDVRGRPSRASAEALTGEIAYERILD